MHLPERDGIYADLLLLDLFLREKARGVWPVSRILETFHELAGPSWYRRVDVHVERQLYEGVKQRLLVDLVATPPTTLAGEPVARTQTLSTNDGFKFFLADGRGCRSGRRAPSRWSGSTPRPPARRCATRCWTRASGWCAARERRGA